MNWLLFQQVTHISKINQASCKRLVCIHQLCTLMHQPHTQSSLEHVKDFTYLGTLISNDIGAKKNKARVSHAWLRPIWRAKQYSHKTKIRLCSSNAKAVLKYESECWRVKKQKQCHSNQLSPTNLQREPVQETCFNHISLEFKMRRIRCLGNVLGMFQERTTKIALITLSRKPLKARRE